MYPLVATLWIATAMRSQRVVGVGGSAPTSSNHDLAKRERPLLTIARTQHACSEEQKQQQPRDLSIHHPYTSLTHFMLYHYYYPLLCSYHRQRIISNKGRDGTRHAMATIGAALSRRFFSTVVVVSVLLLLFIMSWQRKGEEGCRS